MFERLTFRSKDGLAYYIGGNSGDIGTRPYKLSPDSYILPMLDRLAAYEDSGLSPEQVRELAKAKADGRLVVLPCKAGDTVYKNVELYSGNKITVEGKIAEFARNYSGDEFYFSEPTRRYDIWCDAGCLGKTVFLSREAAEKAIAEVGE
jgi:hypothetical protein